LLISYFSKIFMDQLIATCGSLHHNVETLNVSWDLLFWHHTVHSVIWRIRMILQFTQVFFLNLFRNNLIFNLEVNFVIYLVITLMSLFDYINVYQFTETAPDFN
jgi:hypothetical protein